MPPMILLMNLCFALLYLLQACIITGCWLIVEILLLAPPYRSMVTMAIGFAIMMITAAVSRDTYDNSFDGKIDNK